MNSPADINNINYRDLKNFGRMLELRDHAVRMKIIRRTDDQQLRFFALAMHALRTGGNPAALFAYNLFHRNWHHISPIDEDHAVKFIKTKKCPKFNPSKERRSS